MAFDHQAAIDVVGSQPFDDSTHDTVRPTVILGSCWGMGKDMSDLLVGNCRSITVRSLIPDCMNPLEEHSFVNLISFALTGDSVHIFQESICYLGSRLPLRGRLGTLTLISVGWQIDLAKDIYEECGVFGHELVNGQSLHIQ